MELTAAKAWIKRESGRDEIFRFEMETEGKVIAYRLFPAYEPNEKDLGRILFDEHGYWIYDGDDLAISEQEQVVKFIRLHDEIKSDYL